MRFISQKLKMTLYIRYFGLTKVPMIFYCRPRVLDITSDSVTVKIPLLRRNKNHVGSMYLGALSVGADITSAILALSVIKKSKKKIIPIFKDFHAEFLKRAEGDVHFICEDGMAIQNLVEVTEQSSERQNLPVHITATVPKISNKDQHIMRFIRFWLKSTPKSKQIVRKRS